MNKIIKFFKTLDLFIFCLKMISSERIICNYKLDSIFEIWKYCKEWEENNERNNT